MVIEEVRSLDEFGHIGRDWDALAEADPISTPYQLHAWCYGIASSRAATDQPRVLLARDYRGQVVGIAPLTRTTRHLPGFPVIEFIGTGWSDYLGVLCIGEHQSQFMKLVLSWLAEQTDWRIASLQALSPEHVERLAPGISVPFSDYDICPAARLPTSVRAFEERLPSRMRAKLRSTRRTIECNADSGLRILTTHAEISNRLQDFFDLHQARQLSRGERGRFGDPEWRSTFTRMSVALAVQRVVRLGTLSLDDRVISATYNLRWRDTEYFFSTGMDPTAAKYGPGNLLHMHMIGSAIEDGLTTYDFGRGREPYKKLWTDTVVKTRQVALPRSRRDAVMWRNLSSLRRALLRSPLVKRLYRLSKGHWR